MSSEHEYFKISNILFLIKNMYRIPHKGRGEESLRYINRIFTLIMVTLVLLMIYFIIVNRYQGENPKFFGIQFFKVLDNSVSPEILNGSLAVVKPSKLNTNYQDGEIIAYLSSEGKEHVAIQRIIGAKRNGESVIYEMKRVNNEANIVTIDSRMVIGKYVGFSIPLMGYFYWFVETERGKLISSVVVGLILIIFAVNFFRGQKQEQNNNEKEDMTKINSESSTLQEEV